MTERATAGVNTSAAAWSPPWGCGSDHPMPDRGARVCGHGHHGADPAMMALVSGSPGSGPGAESRSEPTRPVPSRPDVFLGYLDYFRSRVISRVEGLPQAAQRQSRLASGWTPLELLEHLTYVELRWLEWGFDGRAVADPWGDERGDRWYVPEGETRTSWCTRSDDKASAAGPSWWLTTWPRREGQDRMGKVPTPRPSNACCFTWCGSSPATSAISTWSPSWPTARSGSSPSQSAIQALPRHCVICVRIASMSAIDHTSSARPSRK